MIEVCCLCCDLLDVSSFVLNELFSESVLANLLMLANMLSACGRAQGNAGAKSSAGLVTRLAPSVLVHYLFTTVAKDDLALTLTNKRMLNTFIRRRLANRSRPAVRTLSSTGWTFCIGYRCNVVFEYRSIFQMMLYAINENEF